MSDLISREAAIDEALTFFIEYLGGAFDEDNQRLLAQRMNSLPSVDITETEVCQKCQETTERVLTNAKAKAEPTHGEWIPVKKVYRTNDVDFPNTHIEWETATYPDDVDAVRCSKCGEVFDFADARNWCTECGAKMDRGRSDRHNVRQ